MILVFVISSEHCTEAINAPKLKVGRFTSYFVVCNVDYNCIEYFPALIE